MDFMIFDTAGNAVESYATQREAVVALIAMAAEDDRVAQCLAVVAFDADGDAIGEPLTLADVRPEAATRLVLDTGYWTERQSLTVLSRWTSVATTPWRVAGSS